MRLWAGFCAGVAALVICAGAPAVGVAAAPLCAFQESTTVSGLVATATFHVVSDGCQVSFVSISKFADGNGIFDTATGVFNASETRATLSVNMPCDKGSETDLVLGPPSLYPPADFDLGAKHFDLSCPAGGGGSTGGGSTGGGSTGGGSTGGGSTGGGSTGGGSTGGGSTGGGSTGGGSTGGGGATALPDLATTVSASSTKRLRLGDPVSVVVSVVNKGKAPAGGVHVLISLQDNTILRGKPVASRGPGCTGVSVIDCDLGSLPVGSKATVRIPVTVANGKKLFVPARAYANQVDAAPKDNEGSLTVPVLARLTPLTITAVAGRIVAGDQLAYLKLSRGATVTAQIYLGGSGQPIRWRRTFPGGTWSVRFPLPTLAAGQRYTIVVRAKSGTRISSARLKLVA